MTDKPPKPDPEDALPFGAFAMAPWGWPSLPMPPAVPAEETPDVW